MKFNRLGSGRDQEPLRIMEFSFSTATIRSGWVLLSLSLLSSTAFASVQAVDVSTRHSVPSARWMFDKSASLPAKGLVRGLAKLKQSQNQGRFDECASQVASLRKQAPSLQPWLSVIELECVSRIDTSKNQSKRIQAAVALVEKNPEWMLYGPQVPALRQALQAAHFATLEGDIKTNRVRAWATIDRLQRMNGWMKDAERAQVWKAAGELAFIEQKLEAARDFFRRSLAAADDPKLRSRLDSIEGSLLRKAEGAESTTATKGAPLPALEVTKEEEELVERITVALKAGDLIPAAEDSVRLLRDFPGGSRSRWASDRILDVYWSVKDKEDPKLLHLHDRIMKLLDKADAERQADWAQSLHRRGQYEDALRLALRAIGRFEGMPRSTKLIELAANAARHLEKWNEAQDLLTTLVTQHAGTEAARSALFKLGMLELRRGNPAKAIPHFERLLVLPESQDLELGARYWLWRSLQKTGSNRAAEQAEILVTRFPFSYYGLRARAELNKGSLEWVKDKSAPVVESRLWLTTNERLAWERLQILLQAGWLEEAQAELRELPRPIRPQDKVLQARLWAAAFNHLTAIRLMNEAWDENTQYRTSDFLNVIYPREFWVPLREQAALRGIEPDLVLSLIRQESAFNVKATSTSSAYGLMQIIPPTAKEIAGELKLGPLALPDDMFRPEQNIQMGTYYLNKLLKKYNGHVPLALAAYNAGPGRMDRWLKTRPSLKDLSTKAVSDSDIEMWFDELPWSETSFYVKAILRNLLLYRMLERGRVQVQDPVWASPAALKSPEKNQLVK